MPRVYRARYFCEAKDKWEKSSYKPTPDRHQAVKDVSKRSADFRLKYQLYYLDGEQNIIVDKIIHVPFKGGVIEEPKGSP